MDARQAMEEGRIKYVLSNRANWKPAARHLDTKEAVPFETVDLMFDAALQMFKSRDDLKDFSYLPEQQRKDLLKDPNFQDPAQNKVAWTEMFHLRYEMTGDAIDLCRRCRKAELNRSERELLLALLLSKLTLLNKTIRTCGFLLDAIHFPCDRLLEGLRLLSEEGRLARSGLLVLDEDATDPGDCPISVNIDLVQGALRNPKVPRGWQVKDEEDFYTKLEIFSHALTVKVSTLLEAAMGYYRGNRERGSSAFRKVERMRAAIMETLEEHPAWGLSRLMAVLGDKTTDMERTVLLALVIKELGYISGRDSFQGLWLARAACCSEEQVRLVLRDLGKEGRLIGKEFIQPCQGPAELISDDPRTLEGIEYALTDGSLEILGFKKKKRSRQLNEDMVRTPRVRLSQLALSKKVQDALRLALAQARYAKVLINDWGLSKVIPYGRAVTVLFYGPPGVGKTACAEGLAHALKKPILVADYSQIQNCWVGQTEKNIVKTFHEARRKGAVLFWDEADAMFYSRDAATRTFEVRDVNVLLQELEKFEGVCILSTNRKLSLDPALDRRISLKVEFEPPDRAMRKSIWEKMLPKKLPLAKDVQLEQLATAELTGGEIKNAVLNAARIAVARNPKGKVRMADFKKAVAMEMENRWGKGKTAEIGFGK